MFGFLCAGCGRGLHEIPSWRMGKERFTCSSYCRDLDEAAQARERAADAARGKRPAVAS